MNIPSYIQEGFVLDGWLVEPMLGRLTRSDRSAQVEPKIMSVLVMLAENQLQVVRKEEFLSSIWKDVNVVDHVLARTISELRRVFEDDPREPRVIETLPKIGYRLLLPVKPVNAAGTLNNVLTDGRSTHARPLRIAASGFAVGSLVTVAFLLMIALAAMMFGGHSH